MSNVETATVLVSKFQNQYWTTDRIRVAGQGPDGPFVVELDQPFVLIGSHPKADISLPNASVARRHLYLHAAHHQIFCLDLDQNQKRQYYSGRWIDPQEKVHIGPYQLEFELVGGEHLPVSPDTKLLTDSSREGPLSLLCFQADRSDLGRLHLTRRLAIVGRSLGCSIQFTTRSISPEHCALYRQDDMVWVIDLQGTGQTRVNGSAVRCERLTNNAQIVLGRVTIRIEMPWEEDQSDSDPSDIDFLQVAAGDPSGPQDEPQPARDAQRPESAEQEFSVAETDKHSTDLVVDDPRQPGRDDTDRHNESTGGPETQVDEPDDLSAGEVSLQAGWNELQRQRSELAEEQERWDSKLRLEQQQLEQRAREIEQQAESFDAREQSIAQQSSSAIEQIESVDELKQDLQQQLDEVRQQSLQLDSRQAELTELAAALNEQSESLDVQSVDFEERLKQLEIAESTLGQERDAMEQQRAKLENDVLQFESDRQQLVALKSEQMADVEQRSAELDSRSEQIRRQEQELAELKNRDEAEAAESNETIEHLRSQHQQEIARLTRQLREAEHEEQAKQIELKKTKSELAERTAELTKRQSELKSQQKRWSEERQKQADELLAAQERLQQQLAEQRDQQLPDQQEILEQTKLLAAQRQELEAVRQKLEVEQKEFDRFLSINATQRQVLANLNELRREKRLPYRFFHWLAGPFRKSN